MRKLKILTVLLFSAFIGNAQEWQLETPHLFNPKSDDTAAGGVRYWHNANRNNWLSYEWMDKKGEKIQVIVIDYDRHGHPDTITTLKFHLANRARSVWVADKIIIQKYGMRDGKSFPLYDGHITEQQFDRLTRKIIDRLNIWQK